MKRLAITAATAALLAFTPLAQAAELKLSHVRPQDATIDIEVRAFADAVAEATEERVTIRIFPASALGDYTTVQERISVGAVDMAVQPAATPPTGGCRSRPSPISPRPGRRRAASTGRVVRSTR